MSYVKIENIDMHYARLEHILNRKFVLDNAPASPASLIRLKYEKDRTNRSGLIKGIGNAIDLAIKELLDLRDIFDVD